MSKQGRETLEADHEHLSGVRDALLNLHKVLVDSERVRYEAVLGPIHSPNQFLQLLTSDPWFAWLRPISQLIVSMDEALDEKEPLTRNLIQALIDQSRRLLVVSETSQDFHRHYFEALQQDPDVVLAHAAMMKELGPRQSQNEGPGNS